MNKRYGLKSIVLVVLLLMLTLSAFTPLCLAESSFFRPTWLKEGSYSKYTFKSGEVWVLTATKAAVESSIIRFDEGVYLWECTDLNETMTKLTITLNVTTKPNNTTHFTSDVYVNMLSRTVYLPNGTIVGTTHLWLPPNPTSDDNITLWDVPPDKVTLKIQNCTEYAATLQGRQKTFTISDIGLIDGETKFFTATCDFDTGVLIDGGLENEATLNALGITNLFFTGRFLFADTNIDLGPNDTAPNILTLFPIVTVSTAFIIILVLVYTRRRKKH